MAKEDKAEQMSQGAVQPSTEAEPETKSAPADQQPDRELSDRELDKVSGGVWRNGKWFPW